MKALSKPMKDELWNVWSGGKRPGYTPRTYDTGPRGRSVRALAARGLLKRIGKDAAHGVAYTITASGKRLAIELFG